MELNGPHIDWGSNALHFCAAEGCDDAKEVLVEKATKTSRAEDRIDTHEVDVGDTRLGLRNKANKKRLNDTWSANDETGCVEVFKKQARLTGRELADHPTTRQRRRSRAQSLQRLEGEQDASSLFRSITV